MDCEVQSFPMLHTALEGSRLRFLKCAENVRDDLKLRAWTCPLSLIDLKNFDQYTLDIDKGKSDPGLEFRRWHYDLLSENCLAQTVYFERNVSPCFDLIRERRVSFESNLFDPHGICSHPENMSRNVRLINFAFARMDSWDSDVVVRDAIASFLQVQNDDS